MNQGLPFEIMQHWTPVQILAVYEFCQSMSEALWREHEDTLLELMVELDHENGFEPFGNDKHQNLELPFDDPVQF